MLEVGRQIATSLNKYGCTVYGLDKYADYDNNYIAKWFDSDQIMSLFSEADIVIISLPLNNSTKNLITRKELDCLSDIKNYLLILVGEKLLMRLTYIKYYQTRHWGVRLLILFRKNP